MKNEICSIGHLGQAKNEHKIDKKDDSSSEVHFHSLFPTLQVTQKSIIAPATESKDCASSEVGDCKKDNIRSSELKGNTKAILGYG